MSKSEAKKRSIRQSQKQAKAPHEHKPLSRCVRLTLIISACVLVAAVLTVGLVLRARALRRARTTVVGFYDVDAVYQEAVQAVLERTFSALPEVQAAEAAAGESSEGTPGSSAVEPPLLQFVMLTDDDVADRKLTEKVDVLITQTGALTTSLMEKAAPESAEIAARFPRAVQSSPYFTLDGSFVVMPLFLDHFETAYYTSVQKELELTIPVSLTEYAEYAERSKEAVTYPIIAPGADDTVLFAQISALAESVAGADGYNQLVDSLSEIAQKGLSFVRTLDLPLKGDAPDGLVFGDLLELFRSWRNEGLILGNWFETKEKSVRVFMEDYHTSVVQMLLSQHRRMPYPMIKYYTVTQFPTDTSETRALIAPSVSYMHFNDTIATAPFAAALSSADEQDFLSMKTMLAPATLRGQSFDMQADDVRFWSASCPGGPVPDLGHAAFASSERRAEFAAWLRKELAR